MEQFFFGEGAKLPKDTSRPKRKVSCPGWLFGGRGMFDGQAWRNFE